MKNKPYTNHLRVFLPAILISITLSCSDLKEKVDKKWVLLKNQAEKLDSLVTNDVIRIDQLDSIVDKELGKINMLDSIIDSNVSKLDTLLRN